MPGMEMLQLKVALRLPSESEGARISVSVIQTLACLSIVHSLVAASCS